MRPRSNALFVLAVVLLAPGSLFAQERGWIAVESNEPAAHVYIDSVYAGVAASEVFEATPGDVQIRLLPPERDSWSMEAVANQVTVVPGDTLRVALSLPYYYRIESIPYGARIYVDRPAGRKLMGETPLTFHLEEPLTETIYVDKSGYLVAEIQPGTDRWNRHVATLERSQRGGPDLTDAEVAWTPPRAAGSRWIDYAAIGVAVVSGVVAVHYKFRADDLYARYEETGDPELEDRIRALDIRSGVALGAMQVGLGVFAIRLVLK